MDELSQAIKRSTSVYDACKTLGVTNCTVYRAMKRFQIEKPLAWEANHVFKIGRLRKLKPKWILKSKERRMWIGLLLGTECALFARYEKRFDSTALTVELAMTDRAYVARFAEFCGVSPPRLSKPSVANHSKVWARDIKGLRALIVLREVLPFLLGDKLAQVSRAIEFFSPTGYRKGKFRSHEVWPPKEFPLRRKGPQKDNRI